MPDFSAATRVAAKNVYERACVGPDDINLIELHDCFATAEIVHYENLGICADGDAAKLIDSGETQLGGRIPVNPSGGLASRGQPIAATGLAQIAELTWQLRGEASARQVAEPRVALAQNSGGWLEGESAACNVHILERNAAWN